MSAQMMSAFFSPKGIVIIGVSNDPTKLGYGIARNLVQSGYSGAIHFVNPRGGMLFGLPVFTGVAEVPDPIELAVLLVPAPQAPVTLQECGQRGISAAIVASGGFRETGPTGAALETSLLETAQKYKMRLVGPNCIGILDTHLPFDTTFLPPPGPTPGQIAFVSHSGAMCAAMVDWAYGQGFGLSRLVSLGNQVDLSESDMLEPVASDKYTKVITLYLEGVKDGRRFVEQAQKVTGVGKYQKPIIALKVGRSESGQRAVASHTGALAGQESAYNAAFQRAGVFRANTTQEMFDWAKTLAWSPLPQGSAVAVVTCAGGPGVAAADAIEQNGLSLASLGADTQQALRAFLPPAASLHNPIDMLASASPEQYAESLRVLLADPAVDSVVVIILSPPMYTAGGVAKTLIPIIQAGDKPVIIALMGERLVQEAAEHLRAAHIPEYRFPEQAVSALAVLTQRAETLRRGIEQPVVFKDISKSRVSKILEDRQSGFLDSQTVNEILDAYGIPTLQTILAKDDTQAAAFARQVGFPVVLKVASPDILHKSDIGGVLTSLRNEQAVHQGFALLMERVRAARPNARIDGVHVQRMLSGGQEVIAGVIQDLQFGPLVMFGSGGVEVEGLKDVAFALAPLTTSDAEYLLHKTWAGRKLMGYRNLPPADRVATREALCRLAQLATDYSQLAEIEINPLRVLPDGEGVVALDGRMRLT